MQQISRSLDKAWAIAIGAVILIGTLWASVTSADVRTAKLVALWSRILPISLEWFRSTYPQLAYDRGDRIGVVAATAADGEIDWFISSIAVLGCEKSGSDVKNCVVYFD